MLAPGLSTAVHPLDSQRRAVLELRGSGSVTVTFRLPEGMVQEGGGVLPLRFGQMDGRVEFARGNRVVEFDPRQPLSLHIPAGTEGAVIYLGGTATPTANQPPGNYSAGISAQVVIANPST